MFANTNLQLLTAELAEVGQMIEELDPRAITSQITLENRKAEIERLIDSLAESPVTAAFVQLLFSGAPVLDTRAIDASFAAQAIRDYQDIITKSNATKRGKLGKRGVVANVAVDSSRFYLTGIARGSFGFTLEENIDKGEPLFDSSLVATVERVSATMEKFCNLADDAYELFIQDIDKRLFSSFKKFFTLLHEAKAEVKILDKIQVRQFDSSRINSAFIRVKETQVIEEELSMRGMLLGLTPVSGTFDFLSNNQTNYSGKIAQSFIDAYRGQVDQREFFMPGKQFEAFIIRRTTKRKGGNTHVALFLLDLIELDADTSLQS